MTRRRSARELERAVEDLEDGRSYPDAGLCYLLSYGWDVIDEDSGLIRFDTGEVKRLPEWFYGLGEEGSR